MLVQTSHTSSLFWFAVIYPSWISNSSEAENPTKNEKMNLSLGNSDFCNYKVFIHVKQTVHKRKKNVIMTQ